MQEFAPAKINLYVHVTGRRADCYHLLDSLVVFADVGDTLAVTPASGLSLRIVGRFAHGLAADERNLVIRAARALALHAGIAPAASITLDKALPVASGIGGGSADAAATLKLLARLWDVTLGPDDARRLALTLGADVPVCLAGRPARMGGIGEDLSAAPKLPTCGIVLVNPGVPLPTGAVFRAREGAFTPPATLPRAWSDAFAMARDLAVLRNDLQAAAMALCPPIASVLDALRAIPGCLLARMSGSGATCFGLFADAQAAEAAARSPPEPGWWCWGGALRPG